MSLKKPGTIPKEYLKKACLQEFRLRFLIYTVFSCIFTHFKKILHLFPILLIKYKETRGSSILTHSALHVNAPLFMRSKSHYVIFFGTKASLKNENLFCICGCLRERSRRSITSLIQDGVKMRTAGDLQGSY